MKDIDTQKRACAPQSGFTQNTADSTQIAQDRTRELEVEKLAHLALINGQNEQIAELQSERDELKKEVERLGELYDAKVDQLIDTSTSVNEVYAERDSLAAKLEIAKSALEFYSQAECENCCIEYGGNPNEIKYSFNNEIAKAALEEIEK